MTSPCLCCEQNLLAVTGTTISPPIPPLRQNKQLTDNKIQSFKNGRTQFRAIKQFNAIEIQQIFHPWCGSAAIWLWSAVIVAKSIIHNRDGRAWCQHSWVVNKNSVLDLRFHHGGSHFHFGVHSRLRSRVRHNHWNRWRRSRCRFCYGFLRWRTLQFLRSASRITVHVFSTCLIVVRLTESYASVDLLKVLLGVRTHLHQITSGNLRVAVSSKVVPFLQSASSHCHIFGVLAKKVHALFHPNDLEMIALKCALPVFSDCSLARSIF